MAAPPYKEMADAAVKGKVLEIINSYGVDWPHGRSKSHHGDCPYANHDGGSPTRKWRVDEREEKIFCTCHGNSGHDVFEFIARMKGTTCREKGVYKAAVIEAMERIGRTDVIDFIEGRNAQSDNEKAWHNYFNYRSLLNPPAHLRDDSIIRPYLAARQGVTEEDAILPSTPCVGIRELDIVDDGKVVATRPCIVFGMVNVDGKVVGAIRTYLSPDGKSKAKIVREDGSLVNVKPFASGSVPNRDAGRAVLYGDPKTATEQATCEGTETGGGIAYTAARRGNEGLLVACGGTAANMRHVPIFPKVEKLYIAADRDEEPNEDGSVSRTGEKAAVVLADNHVNHIPVHVALPGAAGDKIDWLDILVRDGVDAVYDGIFGSPLYRGKDGSKDGSYYENQQRLADTKGEDPDPAVIGLEDIKKLYPLPVMTSEEFDYRYTDSGEWWIFRKKVKKEKAKKEDEDDVWVESWVPVSTPFAVTHRLVMIDGDGPSYALRLAVQGMAGQPHIVDMPRAMLAKSGAPDLKAILFRAGLRSEADGDNVAVSVLKCANPQREIRVVGKPGWRHLPDLDAPIFVSPTGEIIGAQEECNVELADASRISEDNAKAGTFEEWKRVAGVIAGIDGAPHWKLGLCASFAGVLIDLLQMDTLGLCLTGITTRGKSTTQIIAVAAWSNPDLKAETLNHTALTTINAVEGKAQRSSGTVLSLDELKNLKGPDVASLVYKLAGNVGKGRMKADTTMRQSMSWRTFVLLSVEKTLQQAIEEGNAGGEFIPGISVRIPDINVSMVNAKQPPETMDDVRKISANYGHAGPEFVRHIIETEQHKTPGAIRQRIADFARELAGCDDSETIRAATPFAVVWCAGTMAKAFGILPDHLDVADAVSWGWDLFRGDSEVGHDRHDDAVETLTQWLAANWNVKVIRTSNEYPRIAPEAWYDKDHVYINGKTLAKIIPETIRVVDFANKMKEKGILIPDEKTGKNSHTKARTGSKKITGCYWLVRSEVGQPDNEDENMNAAEQEAAEEERQAEENVLKFRSGRG